MIRTTKGRLTLSQRAYMLGCRRALTRMRRELKDIVRAELAGMKDVVDGVERDYARKAGLRHRRGRHRELHQRRAVTKFQND